MVIVKENKIVNAVEYDYCKMWGALITLNDLPWVGEELPHEMVGDVRRLA